MVRCRSKNGHQKDICSKEIGLRAQNLLPILNLEVNIIGRTYVALWLTVSGHMTIHRISRLVPKLSRVDPGFFI